MRGGATMLTLSSVHNKEVNKTKSLLGARNIAAHAQSAKCVNTFGFRELLFKLQEFIMQSQLNVVLFCISSFF